MSLSPQDLARLKSLCDAAGPSRCIADPEWHVFTISSPAGTSSRIYAPLPDGKPLDIAHIPMEWNGDGSNAAFIAAAIKNQKKR